MALLSPEQRQLERKQGICIIRRKGWHVKRSTFTGAGQNWMNKGPAGSATKLIQETEARVADQLKD